MKTRRNRIGENTKTTMTIKQLNKLANESEDEDFNDYPIFHYDGCQLPEEEDKHKSIEALKNVFKTLGIRPDTSAETLVHKALDMHIEIDGFREKNSELFDGNHIRVDWRNGHVDCLYIPFDVDAGKFTDKSPHRDNMSFDY